MTVSITVAAVDDHPIVRDGLAGWLLAGTVGQAVPESASPQASHPQASHPQASNPQASNPQDSAQPGSAPEDSTIEDSVITVVATAPTVDALLAGPGRDAQVVLLDLDLRDGTTVERNVAAVLGAGPAVLVLAASDKPPSVREAMRAGALGYVLKSEEPATVRAAIAAVAAGTDWISPRLAYILATDDAPDRPVLSPQEARALRLYATGMPMKSVARRMTLSEETAKQYVGRVREKYARAGRAAPTKIELYHRAVEDGYLPLPPPP
jgi:two-component system nitrate/nitrite response regulator NarL